jgi:hypothetical protein
MVTEVVANFKVRIINYARTAILTIFQMFEKVAKFNQEHVSSYKTITMTILENTVAVVTIRLKNCPE